MFEKLIDSRMIAGANCLIWQEGKILYQSSEGYRNLEPPDLITHDTLFRIASMTKPIVSALAMMLYEEGKFNLDDSITQWFPQFTNMKVLKGDHGDIEDAANEITILDLLTHRAGFTYSGFQKGKLKEDYDRILKGDIDNDLTNEEWINGLASLPLVNQPGELFNYGKSTDLLGILISKIEGKRLSEVLQEKIFGPLSMTDTFFEVPHHKKSRCAANIGFDNAGNLTTLETVPLKMAFKDRPPGLEFESGSGGLWSTIDDYLKFARIFIDDGRSNGTQLIKKETKELMCRNHLSSAQRANSTLMGVPMFKDDFGFGLGVAVVEKESSYLSMPCSGSVGSVGWPGAYGGWWSADPVKKSIAIFLTHSMAEPGQLANGIGFGLYEAINVFANSFSMQCN